MIKNKNNNYFQILNINGNLEIIKFLENKEMPTQFKQLRNLINPKTTKKYSSATIARNIKTLEEKNIIENKIVKKNKQKIIGYALTKKGESTMNILKEAQEKYNKL